MKVTLFALAIVLARGANALPPLAANSTVPECRIPDKPKILEFGSSPTGLPVNYATPSPITVRTTPPTKAPSKVPTVQPTDGPTKAPSKAPSKTPSKAPSKTPTKAPTKTPSKVPTKSPTKVPSKFPTKVPSKVPTKTPTKVPSKKPTKVPTKRPTKAPTRVPTKSPTKKPTKAPTKAPSRRPTLKPTKPPTKAPVASPSSVCVSGDVSLLEQYGGIAYTKLPITIVPGSQTGSTVTVSIEQVWKESSISWISTRFTDPALGATVCPKKNEVSPGFVNYSAGSGGAYELKNYVKTYGTSMTAACVNNFATIEVFVHDGQFDGQADISVPPECSPSNDSSRKIGYKFSVPCNVCVSGGTPLFGPPTKAPTKSPTKAPVKPPTKPPTKGPTKAPTKGPTKVPTKQPTKGPTRTPVKPPTKSPTKAPTKAPVKPPTKAPVKPPTKAPTKAPTKTPTKSPTKSPTASNCPASLVSQTGTIALSSTNFPIKVVSGSQTGNTVQFQVQQVFKSSGTISWMATRFVNPSDGQVVCPKKNTVPAGLVNYANGAPGGNMEVAGGCSTSWGYVITAQCVNNVASVQLYVHDGQFNGQPSVTVPSECSPSRDTSKKITYNFTIPCSCP